MNVTRTSLDGALVIEPRCVEDGRGSFLEAYQDARYREAGIRDVFVQDNYSRSAKHVLRGLHFQVQRPQAQLVTVLRGRIFDVVVDLRRRSPTFAKWFGVELDDSGPRQMYMAPGFGHGFCVLSDWADVHYKVSRRYDAGDEGRVRWDDPDIGIGWPLNSPIVGPRDAASPRLRDLAPDQLPQEPAP